MIMIPFIVSALVWFAIISNQRLNLLPNPFASGLSFSSLSPGSMGIYLRFSFEGYLFMYIFFLQASIYYKHLKLYLICCYFLAF